MTCIGKDPRCPCQDGDACHYKDCGGTKAWPVPKAEPVGEVTHVSDNGFKCEFNQRLAVGAKLYTTPPAAQQAEPLEYWNAVEGWVKIDEVREHFDAVNCGTIYKHGGEGRVPLYTAPPQRPWVGLTEQDMPSGENPMFDHQYFIAGMVYADKVLKEKNSLKERNT